MRQEEFTDRIAGSLFTSRLCSGLIVVTPNFSVVAKSFILKLTTNTIHPL